MKNEPQDAGILTPSRAVGSTGVKRGAVLRFGYCIRCSSQRQFCEL